MHSIDSFIYGINWGDKYAVSANGKTKWKGTMNSWWWNGKNIRATTKFHTYN